MVLMLCSTMCCIAENALLRGYFAHKTETYANANKQDEGVALPEKERIGQAGRWAYNLWSNYSPI